MLDVALIGYGYWGPNLARVFNSLPNNRLRYISDRKPDRQEAARQLYPNVEIVDQNAVLMSPDVDAVLVATPVYTHFDLAKQALENGKHVWLEKPMLAAQPFHGP